MKKALLLLGCPLLLFNSVTIQANEIENAKQLGREIANTNLARTQDAARRDINAEIPNSGQEQNIKAAEAINFQGTDLPEAQHSSTSMEAAAKSKATDEDFAPGQIARQGFLRGREFDARKDATFLDKAKDVQKNPESYVDWLTSKYNDCKHEGGEDIIHKEIKTCDEYHAIRDNSCHIGQIVEVDAKHKYECYKEREVKDKKCTRSLKVWCEKKHDCDSGGIILKGLASDMQWNYQYPVLTLGTIADNYWGASCGKFLRSTKFEVKNKAAIDEFRVIRLGYDDYLRVTLNGVQLYNEPGGGDFLETESGVVVKTASEKQKVQQAKGIKKMLAGHKCELGISRNIEVDIDLLPHIKEGINELVIEVVVAGLGEGWIQVRTKQHCCIEQSTWEEVCPK